MTDAAADTATAASTTDTGTTTTTGDTADTAAEIAKWKALSTKHEQRAKENAQKAKDYDALKATTMSETEKAVQAARDEGKNEGLRQGSSLIAQAEIRAAAAGRNVDVDALLEGVDATRFIDDQGEVDRKAIAAWIDRVAPVGEQRSPVLDLGQGNRGVTPALNDDPLLKALVGKVGPPRH